VNTRVAVVSHLFSGALVLLSASASSEVPASRCADCHFANLRSDWSSHLSDWELSAHGRSGVGCEACHGGDPATFESFLAHRGVLGGGNPASPVHRMNLPKTCGGCHPAAFAAFQKSRHFALLREGSRDAPGCTTCHGNAGAYLLSPKALAAECNRCHGAGRTAARTDLPAQGRMRLTDVREVRATLEEALKLIGRVRNKDQRRDLELEFKDAEASVRDAVDSAHMFVFEPMQEKLAIARKRVDLLLERLANPESPKGR
jgi:Cytochrome c7 and related cytochrome c/Cytochrome c554 and c-prime